MNYICALKNTLNILKTTRNLVLFAVIPLLFALILPSCAENGTTVTETETETEIITETETEAEAETIPAIETETGPDTAAETEEETTADVTSEPETAAETTVEETTGEQTTEAETTTPPVTETEAETTKAYENALGFKADLSAYEKYMEPEDKDGYLLLVNPDHPLSKDYKPSDLTYIKDKREGRNDRLCLYAAKALEALVKEASENGCKKLASVSAYRPYNTQKYIFDTDVEKLMQQGYSKEEAIAIERKDTAYPGESEHQSGLAVDVLGDGMRLYEFEGTYEADWLAENAWKFGFIIRYPKDKEEITTYVYEPWHIRYVGRYHAKRIYDMGMCLEEYIEYLANND